MTTMKRCVLWLLVVAVPSVHAQRGAPEDVARAEALYGEGMAQFENGQFAQAVETFSSAIALYDAHAPLHVGLGHAHLEQGNLDDAERAFRNALRKERRHAPAFNGLGLVYAQKRNELRRAIAFFRDANRADRDYSEAQYNLAQTLERFGSSETMKEYQNVLKIDPRHPDAHYRIGQLYTRNGDAERAVQAYRDQLDAHADHHQARLHLGIGLKVLGQTDEAVVELAKVAAMPSDVQRRGVLELAQVFQARREFDRAAQVFDAYLETLPEEDQLLYFDLQFSAPDHVLARFRAAAAFEEKKRVFLSFWEGLDPAPVTEANERLLEHYRRVAFAREHFSEYKQPWDARGEAYIRYGDPDHISRSGDIRLERHPQVVAAKTRLIDRAGSAGAALAQQRADEVAAALRQRGSMFDEEASASQPDPAATVLGWPVYPVPMEARWEYWIYVGVAGGIEVTFVQRQFPGPFEYPEVPMGIGDHARIWQDMHPEIVLQQVAARRPSTYRPEFATGPLDFHFYTAAFRGEAGKTALEVYYGIPASELSFGAESDGLPTAVLDRGVAVYDGEGQLVHRQSQAMAMQSRSESDRVVGAIVPEVDRLLVPPGDYRIVLQVLDRISGKSQVYQQSRTVPEFAEGDSLKLSDIQLAASIDVADGQRFQKGDIAVIPMASQAYLPAQPVFIYFEMYNLKRDAFGQVKYRVSYEIQSVEQKPVGASILSGLGHLIGQTGDEGRIAIEYEQVGTKAEEQGYLELDLSTAEPGQYQLRIRVTDETTGQAASTAATFAIR